MWKSLDKKQRITALIIAATVVLLAAAIAYRSANSPAAQLRNIKINVDERQVQESLDGIREVENAYKGD